MKGGLWGIFTYCAFVLLAVLFLCVALFLNLAQSQLFPFSLISIYTTINFPWILLQVVSDGHILRLVSTYVSQDEGFLLIFGMLVSVVGYFLLGVLLGKLIWMVRGKTGKL